MPQIDHANNDFQEVDSMVSVGIASTAKPRRSRNDINICTYVKQQLKS